MTTMSRRQVELIIDAVDFYIEDGKNPGRDAELREILASLHDHLAGITTYRAGTRVTYRPELAHIHTLSHGCHQANPAGTVTSVFRTSTGSNQATVEWDCGLTEQTLTADLQPEDDG